VSARLASDFPGADHAEALRLVESLELAQRIVRSVVFLAHGDLERLEHYVGRAREDWRDVVFWAEYEQADSGRLRQVRSMTEPFDVA
jgi:hypothetical protein